MSMQSTRQRTSRHRSTPRACRQSGIGLVQAMLVLLLVGTALGVGALMLQASRAPQQALGQEATLRWADEAITAFAAANSRLPCPARTPYGDEDCSAGFAKGWLPQRTLVGASGSGIPVGPVAYMVYRGDAAANGDLTDASGNAYQPAGLDGQPRQIDVDDDNDGTAESTRAFAAINGLDLCRMLGRASDAALDTTLARVDNPNAVPVNVAYGIAAAGPQGGNGARLDGGNAGGGASMEAPSRAWDSGYDDRVRIRTFDAVGQSLGCRLLGGGSIAAAPAAAVAPFAAATTSPADLSAYNVSLASMDVLAAAVTFHDTLLTLQENNVGNTEASTLDASFSQAVAISSVVLSVGQLSDATSSMITNVASLTRAVATCIASLGATCWEVPLKVTAVSLSIGSIVANAAALGINVAALPPTAIALADTVAARDHARVAAQPQAADLQSAIDELACTLYGIDPPELDHNPCGTENTVKLDADGNPVRKLDEWGAPIQKRDPVTGKLLFDTNGNPLYEYVYETDANPEGLDDKVEGARAEWSELVRQTDLLDVHRISPWDDSHIRERIQPQSGDLDQSGRRYRKEVIDVFCDSVGANNGEYDKVGSDCVHVGSSQVVAPDGSTSTVKNGAYERREEKRYEFNWDKAIAEAIAKRGWAEKWVVADRRLGEIDREVEQLQDNWDQWFTDSDAIFDRMKAERDTDCAKNQSDPLNQQKCDSANAGVKYIETCWRTETDVTTGVKREVQDTDPLANCKPRMQERIAATQAERNQASTDRNSAASQYNNAPSPLMTYPGGWFYHAIEDAEGDPVLYEWKDSSQYETYWIWNPDTKTDDEYRRRLPFYAPEPYGAPGGNPPLLVTSDLELMPKSVCQYFNNWNVIGWGDTYRYGLYCQRYPYNRAYRDWILSKETSDKARTNYDNLSVQFTNLKSEYEALLATQLDPTGGGSGAVIGFGAESALERADALGSVGAQPPAAGGTP